MGHYLVRRMLQTVPALFLVSMMTFGLLHMVPGDPVLQLVGPDASQEVVDAVRHRLGLDRPVPAQYLSWIRNVLAGDFGTSLVNRLRVWPLITEHFRNTLQLTVAAFVVMLVVGIPNGVLSAVRAGSRIDYFLTAVNSLLMSVPVFWMGLLLILLFSVRLNWLPPSGWIPFGEAPDLAWRFLILPAVTLGLYNAAAVARFTRMAMLDVLGSDYVRTARAKGLPETRVVYKHALRNAALPVITIIGITIGRMMGGAVVVETVFAWPGIGSLLINGVLTRDYPVVQAGLLFIAALFILINFLIDLVYVWLNPRIRLS